MPSDYGVISKALTKKPLANQNNSILDLYVLSYTQNKKLALASSPLKNNLKTLLVDEKNELGGATIYQNREFNKIENQSSSDWIKKEIQELKNLKKYKII